MTTIDRSPARLSGRIAAGVGVIAVVASGSYSWSALACGLLGLALVGLGLVRGSRSGVTAGAVGLFVGALVAGAGGAPALAVALGVAAAVVTWDVGTNAIDVGDHLGREARTRRIEAVHAAASISVGVVTTGIGYGIYRATAAGQPLAALVLLLIAAVLLSSALA